MFSLLPSMQTGIAQLDAEHHDLVIVINRIHAAEQDGSAPAVVKRLQEFREHLAEHFDSEEAYLRMLKYPASDDHAKHHAETVTTLDHLIEAVIEGAIELGDIATQCFIELLGTVITMDMRFLNWHAEVKLRGR